MLGYAFLSHFDRQTQESEKIMLNSSVFMRFWIRFFIMFRPANVRIRKNQVQFLRASADRRFIGSSSFILLLKNKKCDKNHDSHVRAPTRVAVKCIQTGP
jgi:hypothetical protein